MDDLPLRFKVATVVLLVLASIGALALGNANNEPIAPTPTTLDAATRRCVAQADDTMRQFPGVYGSEAEYVAYCVRSLP